MNQSLREHISSTKPIRSMSFMKRLAQYTVLRIPSNQNILGETASHVDERRFDRIVDRRRHFVNRTCSSRCNISACRQVSILLQKLPRISTETLQVSKRGFSIYEDDCFIKLSSVGLLIDTRVCDPDTCDTSLVRIRVSYAVTIMKIFLNA